MNTCYVCGQEIVVTSGSIETGYGLDRDGHKVCYTCCAEQDKEHMREHDKITLYLSKHDGKWNVTNWPGSLRFRASVSVSEHGHFSPFSGYMERRDAWFSDSDGHLWHGRSIGQWTELCHCHKLKDTPDNLACAELLLAQA